MAGKVSCRLQSIWTTGQLERCMEMLKLGFTSIMFDGSALPWRKMRLPQRQWPGCGRSFGVPLEAEIGELCRLDDRGTR